LHALASAAGIKASLADKLGIQQFLDLSAISILAGGCGFSSFALSSSKQQLYLFVDNSIAHYV